MHHCGRKDTQVREELEALVEQAESAQAWQLDTLKQSSCAVLQKKYNILNDADFEVPLAQQWLFTSMWAEELMEEGKWEEWLSAIRLHGGDDDWTASAPRFADTLQDKREGDKELLATCWVDAIFNNAFLEILRATDTNEGRAHCLAFLERVLDLLDGADTSAYSFVAAVQKTARGLHAVLDPTPCAYGATQDDVEFIWPSAKKKTSGPTFKTMLRIAPATLRVLAKCKDESDPRIEEYKLHVGAECTIGKQIFELTSKAAEALQEGGGDEEETIRRRLTSEVTTSFFKIASEARDSLREGATIPCEMLVKQLIQREWEELKASGVDGEAPRLKALSGSLKMLMVDCVSLKREIDDTIFQTAEKDKMSRLSKVLKNPPENMAGVEVLVLALRSVKTTAKDKDTLAKLTSAIDAVIKCMAEVTMLSATMDSDDIKQAVEFLEEMKTEERGDDAEAQAFMKGSAFIVSACTKYLMVKACLARMTASSKRPRPARADVLKQAVSAFKELSIAVAAGNAGDSSGATGAAEDWGLRVLGDANKCLDTMTDNIQGFAGEYYNSVAKDLEQSAEALELVARGGAKKGGHWATGWKKYKDTTSTKDPTILTYFEETLNKADLSAIEPKLSHMDKAQGA